MKFYNSRHNGKNMTFNIIRNNYQLYIIFLPVLIWYVIFCYGPLFGLQIAFKDFSISKGILGSPWVGIKYFIRFFNAYDFWNILKNTITISVYQITVGTVLCVALALMINELVSSRFKKLVQTITYAPHFISTVVMVGMMVTLLSPSTGLLASIFKLFGLQPVDIMGNASLFKTLYVLSEIWQHNGWWAILFIAVLDGVDSQLHEAAIIDGASKLKRIWYINIPSIMPTISIVTILNLGGIMNVGFQKILLMQNPLNLKTSDVIATYVYRVGLLGTQYSYTSAVGLFNAAINLVLLLMANTAAKKLDANTLW